MVVSLIYLPLLFLALIGIVATFGTVSLFIFGAITADRSEELLLERGRSERLISNLDDAVIGYDPDFKIIFWNGSAEKLFKIVKTDIVGKVISPEKISEPAFKLVVQTVFPSLAPSVVKKSQPGEYPQVVDLSFQEPALELTVSTDRILDDKGLVRGFIKVIKNRTREVELIRSKSEFITVAAHQLRTPLTAVHWIFETLVKSKLEPADKELVDNGMTASVKLLKIVNDLLDVSKIESGKFGYQFVNLDIVAFIEDMLSNAQIVAKKFGVAVYFEKPTTPVMIYADPQKLGIALSNLIDNAIKYNVKNGEVRVKIEPYPNKPYIQISIRDTGVGIPPEGIKKLFGKFYRGDNVVRSQTEGTGLGLYIAKNIIVRHGGNISAESILGRGTTFYIVLPTDSRLIPPKEVAVSDFF